MPAAAVFAGGAPNTYVPNTEATNNLVVDFSRNVESFKLNKWTQIIPVTKTVGLYTEMTVEQAGRVMDTTLAEHVWAPGDARPQGNGEAEKHQFKSYSTIRYSFSVNIDQKAVEEAAWDLLGQYGRIQLQNMMTKRTQKFVTLAQTAGTYDSTHTAAVTGMASGSVTGKWDASTTARQDIKRSLDFAMELILKDTLRGINPNDLMLVVSPGCARKMSVSQEIVDYVKGSPDAKNYVMNGMGNAIFGLPERLYGIPIVIEDAAKITSRKGATKVSAWVMSDTSPFICARPGGLVAPKDTNANTRFSTFVGFFKEEMNVETLHDVNNRRHLASVTEDYDVKAVAPVSGFLFTSAVA